MQYGIWQPKQTGPLRVDWPTDLTTVGTACNFEKKQLCHLETIFRVILFELL